VTRTSSLTRGHVTGVLLGAVLTALQLSPPLAVDPNPTLARVSSSAMVLRRRHRSLSLTTLAILSSPSRRRSLVLLVDF